MLRKRNRDRQPHKAATEYILMQVGLTLLKQRYVVTEYTLTQVGFTRLKPRYVVTENTLLQVGVT